MRRLIWLPRLAAGDGAKTLCRYSDQIHPVTLGDSAVYQSSHSHLLVRVKGRNLYQKPFAFQSENWYVFFACFVCGTTCAQSLRRCHTAQKEPEKALLRPKRVSHPFTGYRDARGTMGICVRTH